MTGPSTTASNAMTAATSRPTASARWRACGTFFRIDGVMAIPYDLPRGETDGLPGSGPNAAGGGLVPGVVGVVTGLRAVAVSPTALIRGTDAGEVPATLAGTPGCSDAP